MDYQYDFVCTYKLMDTPEEQEQLYRVQMLQAFNLNVWNDQRINDIILNLFSLLYLNADFKTILQKARNNTNIVKFVETLNVEYTEDLIFISLFNYEYFDLLHRCIADILLQKAISPTHLTAIMNAL